MVFHEVLSITVYWIVVLLCSIYIGKVIKNVTEDIIMISIFHIPHVPWIQYVISNSSPLKKINCHIYSSYWKIIPVTIWNTLIWAWRPCSFSYFLTYILTIRLLQSSEQRDEPMKNETPWNAACSTESKCNFIRQFQIFLSIVFSIRSMLTWFKPFLCRWGSVQTSDGDIITGNQSCLWFV